MRDCKISVAFGMGIVFLLASAALGAMHLDMRVSELAVGQGERPIIGLVDDAGPTGTRALRVIATDLEGRQALDATMNVAARKSEGLPDSFPVALELKDLGYYEVEVRAAESGASCARTSVVILPPTPKDKGLDWRFGLYAIGSAGLEQRIEPLGYYRYMGRSGAKWITTDLWWSEVQPDGPDQWNWAIADHRIKAIREAGLRPLPHLFGIPRWASSFQDGAGTGNTGLGFKVYPPKDLEAWRKFVHAFVTRYKDDLDYLRIWNEPDCDYWLGTPADFAALLKVAYEEAHKVKPEIKIVTDVSLSKMSYYEAIYQHGAANHTDVISVHNYQLEKILPPEQTMLRDIYDEVKAWRDRRQPGCPVWDSEICWLAEPWSDPSWYGHGELDHARFLVRGCVMGLGEGMEKMIWFPFHAWDWDHEGKHYQHSGGLEREDCTPRPAFAAYTVMAHWLGNAAFEKQLATPSRTQFAYQFKKGDQRVTVLWSTEEGGEWITLRSGEGTLRQVAMTGREENLPFDGQTVSLRLTPTPIYLVSRAPLEIEEGRWHIGGVRLAIANLDEVTSGPATFTRVKVVNDPVRARVIELSVKGPGNLASATERLNLFLGRDPAVTLECPPVIATESGQTEFRLCLKEESGAVQVMPFRRKTNVRQKPLWQAETPATRNEFVRVLPQPRYVGTLTLALPEKVAYTLAVDVMTRDGKAWTAVAAPTQAMEVFSVPVGREISQYRVTFRQLINEPGAESPGAVKENGKTKPGEWENGSNRPYARVREGAAHTGRFSMEIDATGRSKLDPFSNIQQIIPVKPNTYYTLSTYVRTTRIDDGWAALYTIGVEKLMPHTYTPIPYTDDRWHKIYHTVRTEPGQTRLRVSCAVICNASVHFDDILAIEGTVPTDIPKILAVGLSGRDGRDDQLEITSN